MTSPTINRNADTYCKMLKSSMISQTDNMPNYNSQLMAKMKTDKIFTSILVKHRKDSAERNPQNLSKSLTSPCEIQNCSEIFANKDCHDSNGNRPKKMLISGQAGIGKTLFCHKLVRDWAKGKLFFNDPTTNHPDLKFTFLLTFRQINEIKKEVNLSELLNLSSLLDSKSMTNDQIVEYFVQHPEQVFIIFDGLDESSNTNDIHSGLEGGFPNDVRQEMPAAVLCSKLIKGKLLKDSVVIITSRPRNAADIERQVPFDSYLEIAGFNEGKVLEYVEKYFSTNMESKVKVLAIFKRSKILLSFAKVPLLCFFTCLYTGWNVDQSADVLPNSLTEFYATVIEHIEKNHNRMLLKTKGPPFIENILDKLSEIASDLIECKKYSFGESYLRDKLNWSTEDIAYIKSSNLLGCVVGVKQSPFDDVKYEYSFLHLTIQEFLVARHLLRSNKGMPPEGRLSNVILQFAAGLARKDKNEEFMFEVIEFCLKGTKDDDIHNRINCDAVIRCLNEYGDKELVKLAIIRYENLIRRLSLPIMAIRFISDLDCNGIELVLNAFAELRSQNIELSPASLFCALNIKQSSLTSYGIQILCESLGNSFCLVNDLSISAAKLNGESITCLLEHLPRTKIVSLKLDRNMIGNYVIPYEAHRRNSVKQLRLNGNKLTDESALGIIRHFPELCSLDLGSNFITDKGLNSILHGGMIQLHLGGNKDITDEGAKAISQMCAGVKKLSLAKDNITDAGIIAIAQNCTALLKLNLENCKLTDEGAIAIAHNCTLLEDIDLRGTDVKYKGVLEIITVCKNMDTIKFPNGTLSSEEITDLYHLCEIRNIRCFCTDTFFSFGLGQLRGGNGRGLKVNIPPEFAI